jgi:hypothetical protein
MSSQPVCAPALDEETTDWHIDAVAVWGVVSLLDELPTGVETKAALPEVRDVIRYRLQRLGHNDAEIREQLRAYGIQNRVSLAATRWQDRAARDEPGDDVARS